MIIKDNDLETFISLYEQEFGETLTADEAREIANRLLELYIFLASPTPREIAEIPEPTPRA